jgi:Mrp family chromosome partitioning ATPase
MGRFLETLSRAAEAAHEREASPVDTWAEHTSDLGDDVPYIEVGGSRPATVPFPAALSVVPSEPKDDGIFSVRFQPLPVRPTSLHAEFGPEVVAHHQPEHPVSEQYQAMLNEMIGRDGRVLLFAGAAESVGTTTVVLNLAITAAREGRVLLIDADDHGHSAAVRLGLPGGPGLREVLARTLPPAWAVQPTAIMELECLTAGEATATIIEDWSPLARAIEGWRARFDLVLIDGGGRWASELAAHADAAYLVLRSEQTDAPELEERRATLESAGGQLRGFVLAEAI